MTDPRTSSLGAFGIAGLLTAVMLLPAFARSRAGELDSLGEQLGVAVLAELHKHEAALKNDDPATLVVVSLGKQGLVAGIASVSDRAANGVLGHVLLHGTQLLFQDGVYELRHALTGAAVELIDARGRVVMNVPLDPPLNDTRDWEQIFLSLARALAARLS